MEESALIQTVDTHAHVPKAGKEQFAIWVKTLFKSKAKMKKNNDNAICALHSPFQLCCFYGSMVLQL